MDQITLEPNVALLESMRSVGYSFDAAVADLVDNSISAGAKQVVIDADIEDGKFVAILDDGCGMSRDTAIEALRLAGDTGPRSEDDLGRFGLGLKTASLSQARRMTVVSKCGNAIVAFAWDIDLVKETRSWTLIELSEQEWSSLPLVELLEVSVSGTLVVWEKLDTLLGDSDEPGRLVAESVASLRSSLSLVFHRYLVPSAFGVEVNGLGLRPLDPFLSKNPKTQRAYPDTLEVDGVPVTVSAFTLPHASDLTKEESSRADLGEGMRDAQGLYVYRNKRLISHGDWYGITKKSELTKQTRIQVDIPASLDKLWQLDIKKSRAEPPSSFKKHLKRIIGPLIDKGRRVHTFRGRRVSHSDTEFIWAKAKTRDGVTYRVNTQHPLVGIALADLSPTQRRNVEDLLGILESSFPIQDAYVELASSKKAIQNAPTREVLLNMIVSLKQADRFPGGPGAAAGILRNTQPFDQVTDLDDLVQEAWGLGR